jgi:hypothetical protein
MDWSTLVSTLVGAAVALAGVWLSPIVGARIGHKQWKRDKLSESAEVLVATLNSATVAIPRQFRKLDDAKSQELNEILARLTAAVSSVMLFGSLKLSGGDFEGPGSLLRCDATLIHRARR